MDPPRGAAPLVDQLYHKLDGIDGNKKPTEFTIEERYQLKGALCDLADRIRKAADSIE